jgi:ribulose kinase
MVYVPLMHQPQSKEGVFVEGVWGPYKASNFLHSSPLLLIDVQDAVFPGWWTNEGGQSSTGQVRLKFLYLSFLLD